MKSKVQISVILLLAIILMSTFHAIACSMYKITISGKTMVGSNYDAWALTPRIWFEAGSKTGVLGAVFTGGRFDGNNGYAPQTGMNESGLTFSRLSAPPPAKELLASKNKKTITNPTQYLKDIMHCCATIDEVKAYINLYDYSYFISDVFIYIDNSGRYLIVEPDTMTIGNEPKYVLANFCPTQIQDLNSIKQVRYRNGVAFLKNKIDTSVAFCTALSDTMHVCREKIGDGTLLTIIRDLKEMNVYLNFYHDYKHQVKFNLKEELAKGNHIIDITSLFPPNAEFIKLCNYQTPKTNRSIMIFMLMSSALFLFSSLFFLVSYFRKKKIKSYSNIKLLLFALGLILLYYVVVLFTHENIFYFPAPYKDYKFSMVNIASYIPYLLILLLFPTIITNIKVFKERTWSMFSKILLTINNITYLIFVILFAYWGLII